MKIDLREREKARIFVIGLMKLREVIKVPENALNHYPVCLYDG